MLECTRDATCDVEEGVYGRTGLAHLQRPGRKPRFYGAA